MYFEIYLGLVHLRILLRYFYLLIYGFIIFRICWIKFISNFKVILFSFQNFSIRYYINYKIYFLSGQSLYLHIYKLNIEIFYIIFFLPVCIFIDKIPIRYNTIIGMAINHIVTPLPSGVTKAPKIMIIIKAYLKFFIQKFNPIKPDNERIYIINGNWKEIPNAMKNCKTKLINSFIFRNERTPSDWPY